MCHVLRRVAEQITGPTHSIRPSVQKGENRGRPGGEIENASNKKERKYVIRFTNKRHVIFTPCRPNTRIRQYESQFNSVSLFSFRSMYFGNVIRGEI
jgi:hypothetical protein